MRTSTRYEIEYSAHYASYVVRDRLTGRVVGRTQTAAGCRIIRSRKEATLFFPELDGPTISANEQYEAELERQQYEAEAYAENAWARAAESNEQYAYECEQDERRALYGF